MVCDSGSEKGIYLLQIGNVILCDIKLPVRSMAIIQFKTTQFIYFFIFIFFPFIFISWRLIALQYCSGFCHTLT